jgi:glucuronate isomerase
VPARRFLDDDFLLDTKTAGDLYHGFARGQPIYDYHCHLSPDEVADNHRFRSLTEVWLAGDHYKWRAMRADGVPERYATGDASDWEKFEVWARTVPHTLRNPLYHWTHMELAFPFGIRGKLLAPDTAREIYDHCNTLLKTDGFTAQGLLKQYNVQVVCTTDDPTDTLEPHQRHARNPRATTKLLPTWRPDRALGVHDLSAWNEWVDRLEASADMSIAGLPSFMDALKKRHDFFHENGCRASDHGLDRIEACVTSASETRAIFEKARGRKDLSREESEKFRSALTHDFAVMDHERAWVQQFHLGAMRNPNQRALRSIGKDTGFDTLGDFHQAVSLTRFLDRLDSSGQLAKTIVYNLNPADNDVLAALMGSFQDGVVPGKMQYGAAWWFLDQLDGMTKQLNALSNLGLLSRFVGMLTDSRSFLSYSRHDYFRRLLCKILGDEVERGLLPSDQALLGNLVQDVCFRNVRAYFGF